MDDGTRKMNEKNILIRSPFKSDSDRNCGQWHPVHEIRRPIDWVHDPQPVRAYAHDSASVDAIQLIRSRKDVGIN